MNKGLWQGVCGRVSFTYIGGKKADPKGTESMRFRRHTIATAGSWERMVGGRQFLLLGCEGGRGLLVLGLGEGGRVSARLFSLRYAGTAEYSWFVGMVGRKGEVTDGMDVTEVRVAEVRVVGNKEVCSVGVPRKAS